MEYYDWLSRWTNSRFRCRQSALCFKLKPEIEALRVSDDRLTWPTIVAVSGSLSKPHPSIKLRGDELHLVSWRRCHGKSPQVLCVLQTFRLRNIAVEIVTAQFAATWHTLSCKAVTDGSCNSTIWTNSHVRCRQSALCFKLKPEIGWSLKLTTYCGRLTHLVNLIHQSNYGDELQRQLEAMR